MDLPYQLADAYSVVHPPPEDPGGGDPNILDVRIVVKTGDLTSDIHPGVVDLVAMTASVDTGTTIDSINWGSFAPDTARFRKMWPLPAGGVGVGPNSLAATVERSAGSSNFSGGQSALALYDGAAQTVAVLESTAPGFRFRQPVPDLDLWWYVEYQLPFGSAELRTVPLDLSEAPTLVQALFFESTANPLGSFFLTPSVAVSAEIVGTLTPPSQAWVFQRQGDTAGFAAKVPFTPGSYDFPHPSQSGRPHGPAGSWRINVDDVTVSGVATRLDPTPIVESPLWGPADVVQGGAVSVELPGDPGQVLISDLHVAGNEALAIADKTTGAVQHYDFPPGTPSVQAAWVEVS